MPDVQVTNHNPFDLKGRYAAKNYVFASERPIEIPEAAAVHIFALGIEEKAGAYNRLGLLRPGTKDTMESAAEAISRVEFQEARTIFDEPRFRKAIGPAHSPGAPNEAAEPGGESEAGKPPAAGALIEEELRDLKRKRRLPIGG
jgi:hypothetical protein